MADEAQLPRVIAGDVVVDERGEVGFVNDFRLDGVKRLYTVANHHRGFVRAWHGHRREAKYVMAMQGAALVAAVLVDDWQRPSKAARVWKFVISSRKPSVVFIPSGYANGFMSLTSDARLIFFSTSTLEESRDDDIRFPARYWDVWSVEER
jgi:dTDP-4-dehydrorhamnose 3,5-epimerase-like enzyme